jgi:hypothetical protein
MQGAREYAEVFETGQYGCLYIVSGEHARGKTFHIQILPVGVVAERNGPNNTYLNNDAVEVYGIISGQPGWTEIYGWKHKGPWQADFEQLAQSRRLMLEARQERDIAYAEDQAEEKTKREQALLAKYVGLHLSEE